MKTVSTLETPGLTEIRRNGNTTRQIDFAIQKLFEGFEVLLQDHNCSGKNIDENKRLLIGIEKRIRNEHGRQEQDGLFKFRSLGGNIYGSMTIK